jgi:hypothetical protein
MNPFRPSFALTYAMLLLIAIFYYCTPNISRQKQLESTENQAFFILEKAINRADTSLILAIKQYAYSRNYVLTENKVLNFQNTAYIAKAKIGLLQAKLAKKGCLSTAENDRCALVLKTINDSLATAFEPKDWQDWKTKIFQIDKIQPLQSTSAVYLNAIQTSIVFAECQFYNYALERGTPMCGYSPNDNLIPLYISEGTDLQEGERLKGWLGLGKLDFLNSRDTVFINGKPQVLDQAVLTYKHAPQPAGRYSLIITGNLKHFTNIPIGESFTLRDTLYYTVR